MSVWLLFKIQAGTHTALPLPSAEIDVEKKQTKNETSPGPLSPRLSAFLLLFLSPLILYLISGQCN